MWWRKYIVFNSICLIGIQAIHKADSRSSTNLHLMNEKEIGYYKKRSSPATKTLRTEEYNSTHSTLQSSLQMPTRTPSKGTLTILLQKKGNNEKDSMMSSDKTRINQYPTKASESFKNRNINKKSTTQTMEKLMSDMYNYLFGTGKSNYVQMSTAQTDEAEPRVLLMTIGIINGLIASGAALSMTGVMVTGLCVLAKMAIAAMMVVAGWIYVI